MKTVFLIAGFWTHTSAATPGYFTDVIQSFDPTKYTVIPVPLTWAHKTFSSYVVEFIEFYDRHKGTENIIVGNSFGAVAAFLAAPVVKPDLVVLCSLSPFFAEDLDQFKESYLLHRFGKRRLADMKQTLASSGAAAINKAGVATISLYGELEQQTSPPLVRRVKQTATQLENNTLVEIKDAPHSLRDPVYIAGLQAVLQ